MVDSVQIFEILKSGSLPEPQARAMVQAIQKAESGIALDVKSVLENALQAAEQRSEQRFDAFEKRFEEFERRMDAFEKRMDERMDAFEKRMEQRMDAFEERMEQRFGEFEKRMDERMGSFERRMDERFDRKFAEAKWEMLRWNVALWLAQLAAVAGIVKMLK